VHDPNKILENIELRNGNAIKAQESDHMSLLSLRVITLCLICMALSLVNCSREKDPANETFQKQTGIIITGNTSLRIDPLIFSARIAQLKKGETVTILNRSSQKSAIGNSSSYWYYIITDRGLSGWLFGVNMKIISSNDKDAVKDYISDFWEEETKKLTKDLSGKWWSINRFGDFTNHCLEIYENNTYKSYSKGNEKSAMEGDYNFDFNQNEIVFLKGTSFGQNLNFLVRGSSYVLYREQKDYELKFKKIVENLNEHKPEVNEDPNK